MAVEEPHTDTVPVSAPAVHAHVRNGAHAELQQLATMAGGQRSTLIELVGASDVERADEGDEETEARREALPAGRGEEEVLLVARGVGSAEAVPPASATFAGRNGAPLEYAAHTDTAPAITFAPEGVGPELGVAAADRSDDSDLEVEALGERLLTPDGDAASDGEALKERDGSALRDAVWRGDGNVDGERDNCALRDVDTRVERDLETDALVVTEATTEGDEEELCCGETGSSDDMSTHRQSRPLTPIPVIAERFRGGRGGDPINPLKGRAALHDCQRIDAVVRMTSVGGPSHANREKDKR